MVVLVVVEVAYVPPVVDDVEVPVADDGNNVVTVDTGELDFLVKVGV